MLVSLLPSSFLDMYNLYHLSTVRSCVLLSISLFFGRFVGVLPLSINELSRVSYNVNYSHIYSFVNISAAELDFKKFLCSYNQAIGHICRVFINGLGDWGSIPSRVILKTEKMVLDAPLLSPQHYKVMINSKVEQSSEWNSTLPYTLE